MWRTYGSICVKTVCFLLVNVNPYWIYAGYYLFVYTLLSQEIQHGGTSKSRFSKVLL